MRFLAFLVLILTTSCSGPRGFDRGPLLRELRPEVPVITDEEIARVLAARPQLPQPFKMAVAFKPIWLHPYARPSGRTDGWAGCDKDVILTRLAGLVGECLLAEVIPIVGGVAGGDDLKSLRLAAARHGADAVLVVGGAGDVDRYNNAWSALYVTIVGALVAPGTEADALFLTNATLWDVRNEYLYASAEADGAEHAQGTPLLLDDAQLLAAARAKGVAAVAVEIERRVRALSRRQAERP